MDVLERFSAERVALQADEGSRHLHEDEREATKLTSTQRERERFEESHLNITEAFWKQSETTNYQTEICWERE